MNKATISGEGMSGTDHEGRMIQMVTNIAAKINVESRLARFDIDGTTRTNVQVIRPVIFGHLDRIIVHFYEYLERFPETRQILKGHSVAMLRHRQHDHWQHLFACEFDRHYLHSALTIGLAHFRARVPPHVYIAAYSFFLTELLKIIAESHEEFDLAAVTTSVTKLVMFDMSVAMNAFLLNALAPGG